MSVMDVLTEPTTYVTVVTAVATAGYSAYRANKTLAKLHPASGPHAAAGAPGAALDGAARTLEGPLVAAVPLIATCSILLLFFFVGYVGTLLTALTTVSGFASVFFVLWPAGLLAVRLLRKAGLPMRATPNLVALLVTPPTLLVVAFWLFTGHWLANNALGISLCILFASLCKIPNLKVAAILFAGLFLYDIFFVFFSERFFGRNVMVEVATSTPVNPASAVANLLHLPINPVEKLAMPAKLIFPAGDGQATMLGLGDMMLPAVFLTFLLEFDIRHRASSLFSGYYGRVLVAYFFSLIATFIISHTFNAAQPALLYIVPALMLTTIWIARSKGQLTALWNGAPGPDGPLFADEINDHDESEPKEQEQAALIP